jgi:ferredoxin--NADP+ reductase
MSTQQKFTRQTLQSVHYWTDSLLSFTVTRPDDYLFVPGQYSRLGLEDAHGNIIWRAYSVVSAPAEQTLEYYGVIVPNGLFTTRLKALQAGEGIALDRQVFGFMTADRFIDGQSLWLLSTGTGLGPYVSMLREGSLWERFSTVVVAHGARHAEDLSYSEELRALASVAPGRLRLVQAVTRDSDLPPGILSGRLTDLLKNGSLEAAAGIALAPEGARVMLCGNPEMIDEMRGLLHERGMRPVRRAAPGQFITENYW